MNIKLIALDLDGTLYKKHITVSEENCRAIWDARQRGVEIIAATGRPIGYIDTEFLHGLGMNYAIACNGACVYRLSDRKLLYGNAMDKETALDVIRLCLENPVYPVAYTDEATVVQNDRAPIFDRLGLPEPVSRFFKGANRGTEDMLSYLSDKERTVYKIECHFVGAPDGTMQGYDAIREAVTARPTLQLVYGGENSAEVFRADAGKGTALRWLSERLGIDLSDTMACGDTENDLDILQTAGLGVAMGNGNDIIKAAADFVTKSDEEDGVAFAIRKFLEI